jgi:hypothetical protein
MGDRIGSIDHRTVGLLDDGGLPQAFLQGSQQGTDGVQQWREALHLGQSGSRLPQGPEGNLAGQQWADPPQAPHQCLPHLGPRFMTGEDLAQTEFGQFTRRQLGLGWRRRIGPAWQDWTHATQLRAHPFHRIEHLARGIHQDDIRVAAHHLNNKLATSPLGMIELQAQDPFKGWLLDGRYVGATRVLAQQKEYPGRLSLPAP